MDNNELYHYGRLGMKWGQHIFSDMKARSAARKRKKQLAQAREAKAERKRAITSGKLSSKKMTDKELKDRIARLELEKKYNDLIDSNKAYKNRGKAFMNKFLDSAVDKIAENSTADVVAQALKAVAVKGTNRVFGEEVVYTNNKKKS